MQGRKYLTVEEIATQLGTTKLTVWRLIRSGTLPAIKVGREYRISRADYRNFLASRRKQTTQDKNATLDQPPD